MKIDKEKIVATALTLLNENGLDRLTTRALAERLGVKQPALYWHFKDRHALLSAMNDAIEAKFMSALPSTVGIKWQDYALQTGRAFRRALLAYRDGARVHAGTRANREQLEQHIAVFIKAGLPMAGAIQLLVSIGSFVVGWVLEEQAEKVDPPTLPPKSDSLAEAAIRTFIAMDNDTAFEAGLRFLVLGAAVDMGQ